MGFIDKFVVNYIKKNLSHSTVSKRNMILRALVDGMKYTFNEDNLVTRYYSLIQWLLDNDSVFQEFMKIEDNNIRANLSEVFKSAVTEYKKS